MLEKTKNYETKLFNYISEYHHRLNNVIHFFDRIVLALANGIELIVFSLASLFLLTQKIMRYTTFPIHWFWIKLQLKKEREHKITDLPLFHMGGHYIYGKPKAGKSTSVYHAMMDYAYLTGKTSYTTHQMELPRKNVFGRDYYYHQLFDPSEFFSEGEQIASFDTRRHNVVVYEEMLGRYHQRNNNKSSHNDEILPLVASMGGQRHQGLDLFYFISQLPTNDISLMQMINWYHEVKIKKGFDYSYWLETGKFRFIIKGWHFLSSKIQVDGRANYKLDNGVKWFYPCKYYEDMKFFNPLNLQKIYQKLPKHKGVMMES